MNCPKCQERLRTEQYRENKYKLCFFCEGVWVDKSELDTHAVLELEHKSELSTKHPCPCCEDRSLNHVIVLDIELDYCSECEGIFFDKGELEAIYPDYKDIDGTKLAEDSAEALAVIYIIARAVGTLFRAIS